MTFPLEGRDSLTEDDIWPETHKVPDLDTEKDFYCEICKETFRMVSGKCSEILAYYYENNLRNYNLKQLISADRKNFTRDVLRQKINGLASHSQVNL